ncbi:MAG: 4Fe-4S binding protein [Candidatus Marinimicrobia bacterium]|nr:4Fe-4S binding protein [Candidatus Neomarinimicrobiota bacterium]
MIVQHSLCDQCGTCIAVCPEDALMLKEHALVIDHKKCTGAHALCQYLPRCRPGRKRNEKVMEISLSSAEARQGLFAAPEAAEKGRSVLLLERKREMGVPVRCGEAVGEKDFRSYEKTSHPAGSARRSASSSCCRTAGKSN